MLMHLITLFPGIHPCVEGAPIGANEQAQKTGDMHMDVSEDGSRLVC